jgi:hypothetical protein
LRAGHAIRDVARAALIPATIMLFSVHCGLVTMTTLSAKFLRHVMFITGAGRALGGRQEFTGQHAQRERQ